MAGKKRRKSVHRSAAANVAATSAAGKSSPDAKQIQWRWWVMFSALIALSVLILFLSWIKFFDLMGIDRRLQDILISYVGSTESKPFDSRVALILVEKTLNRTSHTARQIPAIASITPN